MLKNQSGQIRGENRAIRGTSCKEVVLVVLRCKKTKVVVERAGILWSYGVGSPK